MVTFANAVTGLYGSFTAYTRGQAIFQGSAPAYEKQVQWLLNKGLTGEKAVNLVYPYKNGSMGQKVSGFAIETLVQFGVLHAAGAALDFFIPSQGDKYYYADTVIKAGAQIILSTIILELVRDKLYIPLVIPYVMGS